MKKALIVIYGLSRHNEIARPSLVSNLIEPNDDYEFDIIINTDSSWRGHTKGRADTNATGYSVYKKPREDLHKQLTEIYSSLCKSLKIIYYDYTIDFCNPWFLLMKRIHQSLAEAYADDKVYDSYVAIRADTILTNPVKFCNIENKLLLVSADFTRDGPFHNRDVDEYIGSREPFLAYVHNMSVLMSRVASVREDHTDFFDKRAICDAEVVAKYKCDVDEKNMESLRSRAIETLKLIPTPSATTSDDFWLINGGCEVRDLFAYYEYNSHKYFNEWFGIIACILEHNGVILSDTLSPAVHYKMIRIAV